MEKKVGKIIISVFLLLLCNVFVASESSIILSMQDMNHKPITQAMCKAPFILQVELKNLDGYTDVHLMQYISGIDNFKSSRSMTSHNASMHNGKKIVKTFYNFVLRADKKGKFTLGPLILNDKIGEQIKSNRLIVPVGDEVVASEKNAKETYFMTMSLNKKQVYVGEKLTLSIKFYDRLFVEDLHLQFPDFKSLYFVKNKNKINKSTVVIEEEEYSVTEWVFDMYPTQDGPLIIQDIHAAFFAPELESKFKFGGAFDFFRSLHKSQQHIAPEAIGIDVLPLPHHKDQITAVGQISKFVVTMNQNTAPVGQGIVLSVELFGDANFEMMPSPQLVLPEGFQYYDSNMVTIDEQRKYKRCEFIVQATIPGTYSIESQSLTYFDPIAKAYKTIKSNKLDDIIISPAAQSMQKSETALADDIFEDNEFGPKELKDFSVMQQGFVGVSNEKMIPIAWFTYLLLLLFLIWIALIGYRISLKEYLINHAGLKNYRIFFQARKAYTIAVQRQEVYRLYPIFMQMFNQLLEKNNFGQSRDAAILNYLADKNFSDEQVQSWKNFYAQILQVSFSSKNQIEQQLLFEQAVAWIQLLKEKA